MGLAENIVIKKIRNAFGKDCYNNGELTLAECIVADDYGSEASIKESIGKDKRQPWYDISQEWIRLDMRLLFNIFSFVFNYLGHTRWT